MFRAICQLLHGRCERRRRRGVLSGAGGNQKLASATYPALVVLKGRHGMPAFGDYLSDEQVAEVVNYVRSHFGNQYPDALTQSEVARLR